MGEQSSAFSSNPVYIVIMRNSRGKLLVYVALLGVVCFIVFLLSNTHSSLKELEGVNEKCQQQRDSLSAQLQVVYEHKNRLEKSLQQEKTDHKHTKEANEKQLSELENKFQKEKEDKQKQDSQISQLKTSYSELEDEKAQAENALKQQLKTVQSQKDEEIEKLQTHISELLSEKDKLEVSNNAFTWKLEQSASEVKLCRLQLQQTKKELQSCQDQGRQHALNAVDGDFVHKAAVHDRETRGTAKTDGPASPRVQNEEVMPLNNLIPDEKTVPTRGATMLSKDEKTKTVDEKNVNETISSPSPDKTSILAKPRIMPGSNPGDGVLPKPVDIKPQITNNELDAAIEMEDSKRNDKLLEDPILNHMAGPDGDLKPNFINNFNKGNDAHFAPNDRGPLLKDGDNHPQVVPPNLENVDEKEDHAAERGEDEKLYANPDAKQQVEVPALGRPNIAPKEQSPLAAAQQENNDIVAQMHDMMNKSPGEVNNAAEQNVLGMPPRFNPADNKNPQHGGMFLHRGADGHHGLDDKNYEEDDDDRENDDEPPNGLGPAMKMNNILQDNDFDDQENQDNIDNAKEEEGVVVAPK